MFCSISANSRSSFIVYSLPPIGHFPQRQLPHRGDLHSVPKDSISKKFCIVQGDDIRFTIAAILVFFFCLFCYTRVITTETPSKYVFVY